VLLSSTRACSSAIELEEMSPQTKRLCNADRAAEVMGPVDKGDRIMAKKGARIMGSSTVLMSVHLGFSDLEFRSVYVSTHLRYLSQSV
jgi:hypothetical protein